MTTVITEKTSLNEARRKAAAAFAALDFATTLDRIAATTSSIEQIGTALRTGANRLDELTRELANPPTDDAGDAVMQALLDGEDTGAAANATSREHLAVERDGLREALRSLQHREALIRSGKAAQEQALRSIPIEAAAPWVAAIMERARDLAEELTTLYATATAIHALAPGFRREVDTLGTIAEASAGSGRLLPWRTEIKVPADAIEALSAIPGRSPTRVSLPDNLITRQEAIGLTRFQ